MHKEALVDPPKADISSGSALSNLMLESYRFKRVTITYLKFLYVQNLRVRLHFPETKFIKFIISILAKYCNKESNGKRLSEVKR